MFDSVTLSAIPAAAPAVAGYVNGNWPTYNQVVVKWPQARHLSISVNQAGDAECLDVEGGDATPDQAPAWILRQQARGVARPVVYTSVSAAQTLLNVLAHAGIPRASVRLWTAHYTYTAHLCGPGCGYGLTTTADATQWTDRSLGRNLDESLTAESFFGATPPPPVAPPPSFPISEVTVDMSTLHSQFFTAPGLTPAGTGWFPDPLPIPFDKISGSPIVQAANPQREAPYAAASVELADADGQTVVTYHKLSDGTPPGFTIRWFD